MQKITQSPEDLMFVAVAEKLNCVSEVCTLVDYHPDHGRIEPYWRPNCDVKEMVFEMHKILPPIPNN